MQLSLDIIIPCYNAEKTLERAVHSALKQTACQFIYLVNDASSDQTLQLMHQLQNNYPNKIKVLNLPTNSGVATARNWGALHSQADLIAFLDADDAYQDNALDPLPSIFQFMPELSLVHLRLQTVDLDKKYADHPLFEKALDILQMTVGGNKIFRRNLFLACGGFPQHQLFKELGGEDAALCIALAERTAVGTLFEPHHPAVLHYCRKGMHAELLFDTYLFNISDNGITQENIDFATQVTQNISKQLDHVLQIVQHDKVGRRPLHLYYE